MELDEVPVDRLKPLKETMLTDALEIHYLDMVKFRRVKKKDLQSNPLHRWLVYAETSFLMISTVR